MFAGLAVSHLVGLPCQHAASLVYMPHQDLVPQSQQQDITLVDIMPISFLRTVL
jgi:hypothetical protein